MSNLKSHRTRGSAWPPVLLALGVITAPALCEAAVQSQIDRTTVPVNEPLTLSIVSDSLQSGAQPDLAPLRKDFSVLGSDATSETNIIDGARSDRMRWTIRLMPLHAGSVEIPAIAVGNDRTASIDLTVTRPSATAQAEASRQAFLEVDTGPAGRSTFIQQSIPYTVRLFVDGSVQSGELTGPESSDAAVEQVGQDKHYTASRHGRDYNVIERRYVISPEKSGLLKIAPASFQGTATLPPSPSSDATADQDPGADLMARMLRNTPFANDPMFRSGLMASLGAPQATRSLTAQAQGLTFDVKPRPAAAQGGWLPAENVTLHDSWQDAAPQFRVGEPVTRVITIEAKGVSGTQMPTLASGAPAGARVYPESADHQTRLDGQSIVGISKQTVTYIPSAEGALDIPALDLAWWDTGSGLQRTSTLPARQFKVEAGAAGAAAVQAATQVAGDASRAPIATAMQPLSVGRTLGAALQSVRADWRWLTGGLAVLVLLAVMGSTARRARARRPSGAPAHQEAKTGVPTSTALPEKRATLRALRQACAADDRHAATKALLDLGRIEWPDDPPRGLGALAARVEAGVAEITALDRSLYGAGNSAWNGAALWEVAGQGLHPAPSGDSPDASGLAALYRRDPAGGHAL